MEYDIGTWPFLVLDEFWGSRSYRLLNARAPRKSCRAKTNNFMGHLVLRCAISYEPELHKNVLDVVDSVSSDVTTRLWHVAANDATGLAYIHICSLFFSEWNPPSVESIVLFETCLWGCQYRLHSLVTLYYVDISPWRISLFNISIQNTKSNFDWLQVPIFYLFF